MAVSFSCPSAGLSSFPRCRAVTPFLLLCMAAAGGHAYAGQYAMLLCRVSLGRIGLGGVSLRKPPPNCDSVSNSGRPTVGAQEIFAVFDNAQA